MIQSDNVLGFLSDCFAKKQGEWCFLGHQQGDQGFSQYICVPSLQSALNALEVHDLTGYIREGKTEKDLALDILRCYSIVSRDGEREAASLFGHRSDKTLKSSYGICKLTDEHQATALACWDAIMPTPMEHEAPFVPDIPSFGQMSFGDWDSGVDLGSPPMVTSYTPVSYRSRRPLKSPRKGARIVRDESGDCFEIVHSKAWGTTLIPCLDPEGVKISDDDKEGFKQIEDFPRIPATLWQRWIDLCFEFCPPSSNKSFGLGKVGQDRSLEVSCLLLRNEGDMRTWRILVPKQVVGGGSVKADFTKSIDIETGEQCDVFPPPGWLHAGSSHSHNTMHAFFSGTDDKFELGVPGLHIVVGKIDHKEMSYTFEASVVLRENRKIVDIDDYVDMDPENAKEDSTFHVDCLKVISRVTSPARKKKGKDSKKSKKKP